jgi:hypothetical protein
LLPPSIFTVATSQRDASAAAEYHRNVTRCCIGYLCKSRLLPKPPEGISRSYDPRKTNDECNRPVGRGYLLEECRIPHRASLHVDGRATPTLCRALTYTPGVLWVSNTAAKLLNNLVSRGCHLGWFWGVHGLPSIGLDHPPEGAKPQVGWRRLDPIQHHRTRPLGVLPGSIQPRVYLLERGESLAKFFSTFYTSTPLPTLFQPPPHRCLVCLSSFLEE